MSDLQATAIVTLTLEIPVSGVWGTDCTIGQVHTQAADEALGWIRKSVLGCPPNGTKPTLPKGTRVVGEPKVTKVIERRTP